MTDVSVNASTAHKWQFNIGYHSVSVRPTMPRGITAITWRVQLPTLWLCYIAENIISHYLISIKCYTGSVVQLLVKPGINSHPAQPPLMRPNVHALRYLNFGQFRTPSNFRNCWPWDFCLLTHGHFVLSAKTCNVRLRPKSQTREWRCISASASHVRRNWKAKILNQRVDFLNGEVKHHHHEGIEFRVSILTTPFLREADSSRYIFSNFNAQYTQHGTKGHNDWIDCAPHQIRQICLGKKNRS